MPIRGSLLENVKEKGVEQESFEKLPFRYKMVGPSD